MRTITEIIVHCTATPRSRNVSAADVDRWHRQRGFNQIGYHYLIRLDGSVETGRPESSVGAHCLGHNAESIGVAYAGGTERGALIRGHRDFARKACPSFDATAEYALLCGGLKQPPDTGR